MSLSKPGTKSYKQFRNGKKRFFKNDFRGAIRALNRVIALESQQQTKEDFILLAETYLLLAKSYFVLVDAERTRSCIESVMRLVNLKIGLHEEVTQGFIKACGFIQYNLEQMTQDTQHKKSHKNFEEYLAEIKADPKHIRTIKRFPGYSYVVCPTQIAELMEIPDDVRPILSLGVSLSQSHGNSRALQHLEANVLISGARNHKQNAFGLMAPQILTLLNICNYLTSNAISVSNQQLCPAGIYRPTIQLIKRETGIDGVTFSGITSSQEDVYALKKLNYKAEEITHYTIFCQKLKRLLELAQKSDVCSNLEALTLFRFNLHKMLLKKSLTKHPGYKIFRRVYDFGVMPHDIEAQMMAFSEELIEKLKHEPDPYQIASFIMHEISRIQPYAMGNGKLARNLSSVVLMLHGCPPPQFPINTGYYAAFEACYHGSQNMADYLLDWSKDNYNPSQQDDIHENRAYVVEDYIFDYDGSEFTNKELNLCMNKESIITMLKSTDNPVVKILLNQLLAQLFFDEDHFHRQTARINFYTACECERFKYKYGAYIYFRLANKALKFLDNDLTALCAEGVERTESFAAHVPLVLCHRDFTVLAEKYLTYSPNTAFRRAAGRGLLDDVIALSRFASSLDATDNEQYGRTAMHWAVEEHRVDVVNWLVAVGADYSLKDKDNHVTPKELDVCDLIVWPGEKGAPLSIMLPLSTRSLQT